MGPWRLSSEAAGWARRALVWLVLAGAVGARPSAFNTVRYSEKILERNGISVTTIDLSEILGQAAKIAADDARTAETPDQPRSRAARRTARTARVSSGVSSRQ